MITTLDKIILGANVTNLPTLNQISQGYEHKTSITINSNAKLFVYNFLTYSDYLVEATRFFEDRILIDLGAGRKLDGYILAEIAGAKGYIPVEPRHMKRLHERMTSPVELRGEEDLNKLIRGLQKAIAKREDKYGSKMVRKLTERIGRHLQEGAGRIPVALIAEDMLDGLKRIPDSSVSVLASGIDMCILPESDDEYAADVEQEIARVLDQKGAYIGMFSRFLGVFSKFKPKGLKEIDGRGDWTFKVYTK